VGKQSRLCDGKVNFDRLIPPRCLECHATSFKIEGTPPEIRYSRDYELGISCQKCHGDGSRHVNTTSAIRVKLRGSMSQSSAVFERAKARQLRVVPFRHARTEAASFSYKPGERLEDFLMPETSPNPDVHGNQVGLLELSKCFRSSPAMSCSTCHNVHQQERDLTQLARRCLQCHQVNQCKQAGKAGVHLMEQCLDCHMPNQDSRLLRIETATTRNPFHIAITASVSRLDRRIRLYRLCLPMLAEVLPVCGNCCSAA